MIKRLVLASSVVIPTSAWVSNWDLRESSDLNQKAKRSLFLIRHGQYDDADPETKTGKDEHDDFLYADPLRKLTDLGKEQIQLTANRLAEILKAEGHFEHPESIRIFSSDITRAKESGQIIHQIIQEEISKHLNKKVEIPLIVDSILREGAPVKPSGYTGAWYPTEAEFFVEGSRIESAFRSIFFRPVVRTSVIEPPKGYLKDESGNLKSVDIVVAHGNLIRYSLLRSLQFPVDRWANLGLYNGSISRVILTGNGWVAVPEIGGTGHMPVSKISYS